MRKILNYILIGLFLIMLSGCGVKDQPTVSADANTNQVIEVELEDSKLEEPVIEEEKIEEKVETKEENESVEVEEETIEVEEEEKEKTLSYAEIRKMMNEKKPVVWWDKEVPDEVKEEITAEYNKRLKEKEEGIYYIPENVISEYSGLSDAEIIEIINNRYFELHNEKREELGISLLKEDEKLNSIADVRAEEASYFFSHTRPNGELCLGLIPYSREWVGENAAYVIDYEPFFENNEETFYKKIADDGFKALCNSPGHYGAIINEDFTRIGIDTYLIHYEDGVIAAYTAFEFSSNPRN